MERVVYSTCYSTACGMNVQFAQVDRMASYIWQLVGVSPTIVPTTPRENYLVCVSYSTILWCVAGLATRPLCACYLPPPKAGGMTGSRDGRHTFAMYVHNMPGKPAQFLPMYVLGFEIQFAITY